MKPLTAEWIAKAENDFATTLRESRVRKNPNYDAVCFHAQKCAEKYLKALLQEADIIFGKIHDLVALLDLLMPVEALWGDIRSDLRALTVFAVEYRYPGAVADKATARDALGISRRVRDLARESFRQSSVT